MEWWKEGSWRMIQTNLREIDFQDLDPKAFVDAVKTFHPSVLLLNAGGISASYKTKLEDQYQNPWVKGEELKEIVDRCHENGIRVLARCDFSKVNHGIYEKHPEWAFRTDRGDIMEYNGYVQTCINSFYQQKYAFQILKEIFDHISFDGLYCNMGGFQTKDYDFKDYGFCHCDNCRKRFFEETGELLPEQEDFSDPIYVKYTLFQKRVIKEQRKKIVDFLKTYPRALCFDDVDYARIEASTELKRRLPHWQYHASSNCRVITGTGETGIICSNTTVDYAGYGLRHIAVSPNLQALRLWQNLANRGSLDYYFMGRPDRRLDASAFDTIKNIFSFYEKHEKEYLGLTSCAKVLLRRQDRWVATEEEKGWIRTLTECHIPFSEILPWEYGDADLSAYNLVIMPDSPYLTREEEEKTDTFVRQGGTVILVGESALSDEKKGMGDQYGMDCTGIKAVTSVEKNVMSAMLLKKEGEEEIFTSSSDSQVFGVWDTYLHMEADLDCERLLSYIPPHPYGPPECCYYTEVTEEAGAYVHTYGLGKCVVIPWHPGTFYSQTGHSNPFFFMKDLLFTRGSCETLSDTLTPMVETTLNKQKDGNLFLQMVNTSGSFGVSFFRPLPVYGVQCRIAIPEAEEVYKVEALCGGRVEWTQKGDQLMLKLDQLQEYEGVKIQMKELR